MNCENSFWFWFTRPFAEVLAGLTAIFAVAICIIGFFFIMGLISTSGKK